MEKKLIKEEIFSKDYKGCISGFLFSDLPTDILSTDIIDLIKEEAFYSESDSWDDFSRLTVYREREENDVEFEKRIAANKLITEELKSRRFESYQKLKKEFEP